MLNMNIEDCQMPEYSGKPDSLVIPIAIPFSYRYALRYHRIKIALSRRKRERPREERKINEYARKALIQMMDAIEAELIAEGLLQIEETQVPVTEEKSA